MRIGIPAEIYPGETRVAATPETVKKMSAGGRHSVMVETGAGVQASIPDTEFVTAGATLGCAADIYSQSDIILKVRRPEDSEVPSLRRGTIVVGLLSPHLGVESMAQAGVTAFAMELLPRISRAQSMDVLSSQGNIAGYKAVILAANEYGRFMPMLMTAAGTVKAARVLILGAGVAGLQAIATAKRLGAVIEAFDVRPAVQAQVESLEAEQASGFSDIAGGRGVEFHSTQGNFEELANVRFVINDQDSWRWGHLQRCVHPWANVCRRREGREGCSIARFIR